MTLDDLLALLPDNDTGAISAADMRTVVTGLWERIDAMAFRSVQYQWTTNLNVSDGQVTVGWGVGAAMLNIAKRDKGGNEAAWDLLFPDTALGTKLRLRNIDVPGPYATMHVTDSATDQGDSWAVPVTVDVVNGAAPAGNNDVMLDIGARAG